MLRCWAHQPMQDFGIDEKTREDGVVSRRFVPHLVYLSGKTPRTDPPARECPSGTCHRDRMPM